MARLPETLEEQTIDKMLPGDKGYTVPWAMYAEPNRDLFLNGKYSVQSQPGGTVQMHIERTETGVIVDQKTIGKQKYSLGGVHYVGGSIPLPVEPR